jgi:pantetheine-phosphate adenylyltransferase
LNNLIKNKKIAIYSGTFDPITNGHMNIIERSLEIFDELILAIAESREKSCMFSLQQREEMAILSTEKFSRVKIKSFRGLLVDFLKDENISIVIRGLRNGVDFEYERNMHYANKSLYSDIETIYLNSKLEDSFVSSSVVRTLIRYNGNIDHLVPNEVIKYINSK